MKVEYADNFNKSLKKIKDNTALKRLDILIEKLKEANSLKDVSNVKAMANNPFLFRIRTGDYRLVVEYRDGEITILLLEYLKRNENTYKNYN